MLVAVPLPSKEGENGEAQLAEMIKKKKDVSCSNFLASLSRSMVTTLMMMMPLAAACNYRESGKFLLLLSLRWSGGSYFSCFVKRKELTCEEVDVEEG